MVSQPSRKIGKYRVLSFLGRGGMAEVFKCDVTGIGGFSKVVVVKRILPELQDRADFVEMFLDEARLMALLNHDNIVQVFEVAEVEDVPIMTLEYVDGPTFRKVIRHAHKDNRVHFGHLSRIAAGIAAGLDHAHHATDAHGEPLRLVHRDVSPHNILVSMAGVPKLLDFGVAKAKGRLHQTHVGGLKGKLAYVAPETIEGEEVTPLSDIYSLGVTLYLATVGRLPFNADSEGALLRAVLEGSVIPPTRRSPGFPEALERILLWTLERNPNRRCPSASMLRHSLETFFASGNHSSDPREYRDWLKDLFPNKASYMDATEHALAQAPTPSSTARSDHVHTPFPEPGRPLPVAYEEDNSLTVSDPDAIRHARRQPLGHPAWRLGTYALAAVGMIALAAVGLDLMPNEEEPPQTVAAAEEQARLTALHYLNEAQRMAEDGRYNPALELVNKADRLGVADSEAQIRITSVRDELKRESNLALARRSLKYGDLEAAIEHAKAVLDSDLENEAALDILSEAKKGQMVKIEPLPAEVAGSKRNRQPTRATTRRVVTGKLSIVSTPPGTVYVDDTPVGETPILIRDVKMGKHFIEVRSLGHVPQTRTVDVQTKRATKVRFELKKPGTEATEKSKSKHETPVVAAGSVPEGLAEGLDANPDKPEPAPPPPPAPPKAGSTPKLIQPAAPTAPVMLTGRAPRYPPRALEREIEGTVVAKCRITVGGTVEDCNIVESVPYLDQEVIRLLQDRTYRPATFGGKPIEMQRQFKIRFTLPLHR